MSFNVPRVLGTCADCGIPVLPDLYRRVTFTCRDNQETFVSFCPQCEAAPFTPERMAALNAQTQNMFKLSGRVHPQFDPTTIVLVARRPGYQTVKDLT
jgi:hypothetical protein